MAGPSSFPIAAFYFRVEFENLGSAISFQEVTGLEESSEVLEYRDGLFPFLITQKRAGMMKSSTITMKRGIFEDRLELIDFLDQLQMNSYHPGGEELLNITVSLLDETGEPIMYWQIFNAFPIKVSGPTLKSDSTDAAIESIEFAHEGIIAGKP